MLSEWNALITAIKENNPSTEGLGAFLRNKSNPNLLETLKVLKDKAKLLGLTDNKELIEKKPKAKDVCLVTSTPKEVQRKSLKKTKQSTEAFHKSKTKRRDTIVKLEAKRGDIKRNERGNARTVDIMQTIPFQDIVRKYDFSFEDFFKDPDDKASVSYLRKYIGRKG